MNRKDFVTQIPEPAISRLFFADTRLAWLWLPFRVYVGWIWLDFGWKKLHDPLWIGEQSGLAVRAFINAALKNPDVAGWYARFLEHGVLPFSKVFAHIIACGEILVGLGLVLGAFTGLAAFFGSLMNMSFLFAGTVSVNPIMALLQLFLILAWRTAGWLGVDRYLLPLLGTPWHPGELFRK